MSRAATAATTSQIAYNSCRNRHCPKCQGAVGASTGWSGGRPSCCRSRTSTSSSPCRRRSPPIAFQNKAVVYDLLFRAAAETLLTIAADPKHLGREIGLTAVLHTWGSAMTHHPHVHCVVPGGGLSPGRLALDRLPPGLLPARPGALAPVPAALPRPARRRPSRRPARLLRRPRAARRCPPPSQRHLAPLRRTEWVVYAKPPFGGPEPVLAYLAATPTASPSPTAAWSPSTSAASRFRWKDYRARTARRTRLDQDHDARRRTSSSAASCCTSCPTASTASATTACSPAAPAPPTLPGSAACLRRPGCPPGRS